MSTYRGPACCSDCGSEERLTITCERCLTLFEEYGQQCKAIAETCRALANIGTGVLIAHLADLLATANQAARMAHDSMHQDLATIREWKP